MYEKKNKIWLIQLKILKKGRPGNPAGSGLFLRTPGPALFISPAELLVVRSTAGIYVEALKIGLECTGVVL